MRIDGIKDRSTNFSGTIKNTALLQKQIKQEIARADEDTIFSFFNTLNAVKNDTANQEFILDEIDGKTIIKYGKEKRVCNDEANIVEKIIDMGKDVFGYEKIFNTAKKLQNAFENRLQALIYEEEGTLKSQKLAEKCNKTYTELFNNAFQSLLK